MGSGEQSEVNCFCAHWHSIAEYDLVNRSRCLDGSGRLISLLSCYHNDNKAAIGSKSLILDKRCRLFHKDACSRKRANCNPLHGHCLFRYDHSMLCDYHYENSFLGYTWVNANVEKNSQFYIYLTDDMFIDSILRTYHWNVLHKFR